MVNRQSAIKHALGWTKGFGLHTVSFQLSRVQIVMYLNMCSSCFIFSPNQSQFCAVSVVYLSDLVSSNFCSSGRYSGTTECLKHLMSSVPFMSRLIRLPVFFLVEEHGEVSQH